jgi:hypothetical protein
MDVEKVQHSSSIDSEMDSPDFDEIQEFEADLYDLPETEASPSHALSRQNPRREEGGVQRHTPQRPKLRKGRKALTIVPSPETPDVKRCRDSREKRERRSRKHGLRVKTYVNIKIRKGKSKPGYYHNVALKSKLNGFISQHSSLYPKRTQPMLELYSRKGRSLNKIETPTKTQRRQKPPMFE